MIGRVPIRFDGEPLQREDLTLFCWIDRGLNEVPRVRGKDVTVPGLAGRSERNRRNDILPIVLICKVGADPDLEEPADVQGDWRTTMRFLRTLFHSSRGRGELMAILEDGDTATIQARPMNISTIREINSEYWEGSIELEGYDDWLYEAQGS